jgi:hypothetical protein
MDNVRFPEFLASLETTKYPFVATASLSNGRVSFLEGTFLDAHLYSVASAGRYYISRVVVQSDHFIIYVGDSSDPLRLSGTVPIPTTTGVLQLKDIHQRPGGILVSEPVRLALLSAWGIGTYTFERNQTEFCVTCQMPISDPGVSGLRLETGEILTGRVWLVGEDGVLLRTETVLDQNNNLVARLRADVIGDPLYLQRLCTPDDLFVPVNPIRIIRIVNGETTYDCEPDEFGNFNIQMNDALAADAALRVRTTTEGILITVEGTTPTADNNPQ